MFYNNKKKTTKENKVLFTKFPFQNLTNNDLETLQYENRFSENDKNRLSQLKFDPFQLNAQLLRSENSLNLDASFNTDDIKCDYLLPNELQNKFKSANMLAQFSLLHLNIRSISNKFDSFKNLIKTLNIPFQIIGLTETWLNDSNMNDYNLEKHTYISSNRSKRKGGGVGLYVSNQLDFKIRNDLTKNLEDIIETVFIEILTNVGKNIIIGVIYRPPKNKFN